MSKVKTTHPQKTDKETFDAGTALLVLIGAFFNKFGVPGGLLIACLMAIQSWASDDQKRKIIDVVFGFNNQSSWWNFGIVVGGFIFTLLFQRFFYRKKIAALEEENKSLQAWIDGRNNQKPRKR